MGLTRNNVFPSRYLGKDDVARPLTADIADVRMETIKGEHGDEDKAVMSFADPGLKPMIVNSTNWDTIESAYGPDADGWRGRPVEVYVDPGIMFGGKRVGGVRVRIPAGAPVGNGNNGVAAPSIPLMTWDQAVAAAAAVGITRDRLIEAMKAQGRKGYNAQRDTAAIQGVIAAMQRAPQAETSFGDASTPAGQDVPPDDSIPF